MSKAKCPKLSVINSRCDCNYVRPKIEKIEMKYNKKKELMVRINGVGKWYPAELNGNKLSFFA